MFCLNVNSYLINNLWLYHLILTILVILIVYFIILIRKTKSRKEFLARLSMEEGPLAPRNLLPTLIDSLPDFIYIKDKKGRFIVANKKLAETVGELKGEMLVGHSDFDYYPKKLAEKFRLDELEIMNSGKPLISSKERGLDKNGNDLWVATTKIPIKNSRGEVVGIAGIGIDITESIELNEKLVEQKKSLEETNTLLEERQEEILQQQEEMKVQAEMLAREKNLLLTLINSMPDMIYIKDRQSRFIMGNKHVAGIMGAKNPDELQGKTDYDFYPEDMAEAFYNDEQELMKKDKRIINKEERGLNEEGKEVIVSTTKIPFKDGNGQVIGVVGIGRDITYQKLTEKELKEQSEVLSELNVLLEERQEEIQQQAEELKAQAESLMMANEELEKLSMVASRTGNVIVIMDSEGNFEWVNEGFRQRYGMDLESYIKKNGKNLKDTSGNKEIIGIFEKVQNSKKPGLYESSMVDQAGNELWSQTTISPILNEKGDIISLIAIDTDITQIKEAELQIQTQRDELKKVNATKDKLFSIIAHDLKNPFHSIMGFSDLLNRSFESVEDERKKEFIKHIYESSTSAYSLLENLLNWARTQTNKIKYEPSAIDLKIIIEEIFIMVRGSAENKNIKLIPPDQNNNLKAFADFNMVNTIIRNLVSNAIKFTEEGGNISIETNDRNNRIYITIRDTGTGMSKETLKNLFNLEKFESTQGTSGESGTGLGLIVCKEFVNLHGGDIEVESKIGEGSAFTFSLPTDEVPE